MCCFLLYFSLQVSLILCCKLLMRNGQVCRWSLVGVLCGVQGSAWALGVLCSCVCSHTLDSQQQEALQQFVLQWLFCGIRPQRYKDTQILMPVYIFLLSTCQLPELMVHHASHPTVCVLSASDSSGSIRVLGGYYTVTMNVNNSYLKSLQNPANLICMANWCTQGKRTHTHTQ